MHVHYFLQERRFIFDFSQEMTDSTRKPAPVLIGIAGGNSCGKVPSPYPPTPSCIDLIDGGVIESAM